VAERARPAPVRIDDLASPRFPADVEPILGFMAEMGGSMSLTPDALMEAAAGETGLDDFGAASFKDRLAVLCETLSTEAGLSPAGRCSAFGQLTGLLKNRLLIEDLLRRHPEIDDLRIERPIIICGLPRTGTTHLHNLMSADPALRSLPYWESLEPVLSEPEQEQVGAGEPDPRLARTARGLEFLNTAMPHFKRMHEMTVDHVHEEIQLLAIDFSTMLFETMAPMPTWRDYYLATDQTPIYGYLVRVLKALQWLRNGAGGGPRVRWVLKSPQHLEQFPVVAKTFPDATFVVTHRDPVSVTASLVTMMTYTARLSQAHVDPVAIGGYWSDRVERMLRSCVEDRDALPAGQSIDVRFAEFMADDVAMVARIYQLAGQAMTPAARASMDRFMLDHPRGRHGGVIYDLAQFGLDREERTRALQFYADRFGVDPEV
jgi:hypothetical protein